MTQYRFLNRLNSLFFISLITTALLFFSSALYGQSPVNFSGVWIQDNVKSDDSYKSFDVKCTITQTPQTISIIQTFFDKSGAEIVTRESSFTLDGKEKVKKEEAGINKESAKWSADKKVLTTSSTITNGPDFYGTIVTYSISDNGLVLTVETKDINPMGQTVKQIFNKKQ